MKKLLVVIGLLFSINFSFGQTISDGLIAYYPFNGNANDESGNGNDGIISGVTLDIDRFNTIEGALFKQSSNQGQRRYVNIGDLSNFYSSLNGNGQCSFATWVQFYFFEGSAGIMGQYNNGPFEEQTGFEEFKPFIIEPNGIIKSSLRDFTGKNYLAIQTVEQTNVVDGAWHHLAVTFDGLNSEVKLYLDGIIQDIEYIELPAPLDWSDGLEDWKYMENYTTESYQPISFPRDLTNPEQKPFTLGLVNTIIGPEFDVEYQGKLDDCLIYNRVITPEEIQEIYEENYINYIEVQGSINGNETWSGNIKITGDVIIESGGTLNILSGTLVKVDGPFSIKVYGKLFAIGNEENVITFIPESLFEGWKGIKFFGDEYTSGNSEVSYCIIVGVKDRDWQGGVIYNHELNSLKIDKCIFRNNFHDSSIIHSSSQFIQVSNSEFFNNLCNEGNIYFEGELWSINNYFHNNRGGMGGAIKGSGKATNCYVINNIITNNWSNEGAIMLANYNNCYLTIINSSICNNSGRDPMSGGIFWLGKELKIINSIFYNNYAVYPDDGQDNYIHNEIFFSNSNATCIINNSMIDGGIYDLLNKYHNWGDDVSSILYQNLYDVDPQFIYPSETFGIGYYRSREDWGLLDNSELIDAGTLDIGNIEFSEYDILGNPRIVNSQIDVGAIEYFISKTPEEDASEIISIVIDLNLEDGFENSLTSTLDNAIKSLEKGNSNAAINQLNAFINKVEAQRDKDLTSSEADNLINAVLAVIDKINTALEKNFQNEEKINNEIPIEYSLDQNYPNPFNPNTSIQYSIKNTDQVKISIFNTIGEKVIDLVDEIKTPGHYTVSFNAKNLVSGIYFYVLKSGEYREIKKMILLK